jgi:GNAT superfamily N-acetyltransferase
MMIDARNYFVEDTLRNGIRITIRAVRRDDRSRIAKAFSELDRESIYTRFFGWKKELTEADFARIDATDFVRRVMLLVTTRVGEEEIVIGAASYVADEAEDGTLAAEVAFTVEEDYQGLGIAGRLLRHLADIARERGITRFQAEVLAENKAMLAVFARSGLPMRQWREDEVIHLVLALTPAVTP